MIRFVRSKAQALGIGAGIVLGLLAGADPARADDCHYLGNSPLTPGTWTDSNNWRDCHAEPPGRDDIADFGPLATAAVVNVDEPRLPPTVFGINFGLRAAGLGTWRIIGNPIGLTSFLTVSTPAPSNQVVVSVEVPIVLAGDASIENTRRNDGSKPILSVSDIVLDRHLLTFDETTPIVVTGVISGEGSMRVLSNGDSTQSLTLERDNTYRGTTEVGTGIVTTLSAHPFGPADGGAAILREGTELRVIRGVTLDKALTFDGNATLSIMPAAGGSIVTMLGDLLGPQVNTIYNFVITNNNTLALRGKIGSAAGARIALRAGGTLVMGNPAGADDPLQAIDVTLSILRIANNATIPDTALINLVSGTFDLHDFTKTIGPVKGDILSFIHLGSGTLTINQTQNQVMAGTITGTGNLVKTGDAVLTIAGPTTYTGSTTLHAGTLELSAPGAPTILGPLSVIGGRLLSSDHERIADSVPVMLNAPGIWDLQGKRETIGSLAGSGVIQLDAGDAHGTLVIGANNASTTFSGSISGVIGVAGLGGVQKIGTGTLTLTGTSAYGQTLISGGALLVNGALSPAGTVFVNSGLLGGVGSVGTIQATGSAISPGVTPNVPGTLHAAGASLTGGVFAVQLTGLVAGAGYDQLDLTGNLTLSGATALQPTLGFQPLKDAAFTIINLAPGKTVTGTFNGLAEGAELPIGDRHFRISYHGGDGNDVVLTAIDAPPAPPAPPAPSAITYYLSEGATGGFFDEDVLIANPTDAAAPVTLTFSKENGEQVVATKTVPAQSRLTVHVDQIAGLEATAASAQVTSDAGVPLFVERSMFWDKTYYAGHTGSAVDTPAADWFFAEGSQGFFDTFVLVINPNATPADVTFTFFRENEAPVVKTVTVGATTRLTLHAGDVPELVNRSFGIAVHATQPIMAERSMYFGTTPTRLWSGGTESAGVTAASTHWFLAEGATGGFFDTFVLLSNPQSTDAHVTLQYLLDTGDTITVPKTIAANARLTTNIEAEDDVRLHDAAVSTVVTSDQPIIAERSMYWPGAAVPWGEGHNSFGVIDAGTKWGLAEGRTGGPLKFHTYILLANPQTTDASVKVTFLRETGTPVTQTYTVSKTSRFNIDVNAIEGLQEASFGALIEVTNGVPIIVERSMYWDSNGFLFSGGTNATGIRLQ